VHTVPGSADPCGFQNPPGAQFCASCGQALQVVCLNCGTALPAGFSFCTSCGTPLTALHPAQPTAVVHQPQQPVAERRLVSVIFCDLVDFTAIAERLDPEEVRDLLSRYFETAREITARYGGTIEKFIGDAVMAVWGTPVAHEDDPTRAVRSALEIVDAVAQMRTPGVSVPLAARGAVATGETAVMIGVEGQGMVAGDIVNTASRLQSVAEAGTVLLNEATRQATVSSILARRSARRWLKGKAEPVPSWRAIRALVEAPRSLHESSLVGRERELDDLVAMLDAVVRAGRSRLVSVIGIPGIGKSRLATELGRRIARRREHVTVLLCRAPGRGEGTPFGALADVVRQQLKIGPRDGIELAERKLSAVLRELADDTERAWLEPRLEVLLNPTGEVASDREELFGAWRRFLELLTTRAPLVFVLDDAHRADGGLLDFVEHCVQATRDRPMLFVTLSRPELLELRPGWGAGVRSFSSIHLDRLSEDELKQLLTELAPALPARLVGQVVSRADGVPLYAVELARMVQAPPSHGVAEAKAVPGSLHGLIAARIDGLPPVERQLLLSASVLSDTFTAAELAAVAELDPATVRAGIDALMRQEALTRHDPAHPVGVGQLRFHEQLVQEIAYRTLARRDRRRRHLAAAAYLEQQADESDAEEIAGHLVNAYRADPAHIDAPGIARRAQEALRVAAKRATAVHSPQRTLAHLTAALSLPIDDVEKASLIEGAAAAAQAAGQFKAAERRWRELVALRKAANDRAGAARASARLASLLFVEHSNDAALREVDAALRALGKVSRDDPAGVELASQLARAHFNRGDPAEAKTWAEQALQAAERLQLEAVATEALITRGTAQLALGETKAGVKDLNRAIARCSEGELLALELRARNNLAWLLVGDDPRATFRSAREGFEIGHQKGMHDMALQLASVAMAVAIDTGDWQWALDTMEELDDEAMVPAHLIDLTATTTIIRALRGEPHPDAALTSLEPFPPDTDPQVTAQAALARAWIALLARRFPAARRLADEAAAALLGFNRNAALVLATRAALWADDADAAGERLDALKAGQPIGRAMQAAIRSLDGGLAARRGRPRRAASRYRGAFTAWQQLDLPLPHALALIERDAFAADGTDPAESAAMLARLGAPGLKPLTRTARRGTNGRAQE
jgi:class 3 adenylate cyclase/tetratricopeptide (TPR) repeat protein